MGVERLNPPGLATPAGYSHAVLATGTRTVYLAGQTALDGMGQLVGGGVVGQFEQALTNLLAALASAGGDAENLVRMTCYLVDVNDYRDHAHEIGAVWRRIAGRGYPAMAAVGVTRLWDAEALVELDGIAVLP